MVCCIWKFAITLQNVDLSLTLINGCFRELQLRPNMFVWFSFYLFLNGTAFQSKSIQLSVILSLPSFSPESALKYNRPSSYWSVLRKSASLLAEIYIFIITIDLCLKIMSSSSMVYVVCLVLHYHYEGLQKYQSGLPLNIKVFGGQGGGVLSVRYKNYWWSHSGFWIWNFDRAW